MGMEQAKVTYDALAPCQDVTAVRKSHMAEVDSMNHVTWAGIITVFRLLGILRLLNITNLHDTLQASLKQTIHGFLSPCLLIVQPRLNLTEALHEAWSRCASWL